MTQPDPASIEVTNADAVVVAPAQDAKPEPDWKAEARKWEQRAKENTEAAKRLQEMENAQKSEQQRLTERAEAAEKERDSIRLEALRLRIASEKGLTSRQAARLIGSSEEELAADADALLQEFPTGPRRPSGDVGQGARDSRSEPDDPASLAAAALAQRGY